jgi:hypothetical protein
LKLDLVVELDYDSGTYIYFMSIQISDGVHNTRVSVLVRLRPVNEFDPKFTNPTVNVNEIAPIGYEIMTYTADDRDVRPHDVKSYQILSGKMILEFNLNWYVLFFCQ